MNNTTNHTLHKSHRGIFVAVFVLLCLLTGLSFWVANSWMMDDRMLGWATMLGISVCKAMLVITFFMHLWWERAWKYAVTIPTVFMGALLVVLLWPDVGMRTIYYSSDRETHGPEPVALEYDDNASTTHSPQQAEHE